MVYKDALAIVMIQGRFTHPLDLKRSLRKGFPLSPVLYLLVANALSVLVTNAADEGRFRGVHIEETDDQFTHSQFVDDMSVIVEAKKKYVDEVFQVFHLMGRASGLFIKETRVKAIFISSDPMPNDIKSLDCAWEEGEGISKLLGFHVGTDISEPLALKHLQDMLERRLKHARLNPYSLLVWVTVAYQLVACSFWYTLELWSGKVAT